MKPLWKVKGFEKQTYQPQQTVKDTRTDRRKVTVMHKTSRRTGTGTARRGTAQDSTGEQNRQGDTETTVTFRAPHGNHIVSIPFESIVKKKRPERFRPQMSRRDIHPPPPHDMQFACLSPSFLISVIHTGCFFGIGALVFEKVLSCETRGPIQRNRGPIQRNTVSLNRTAHE